MLNNNELEDKIPISSFVLGRLIPAVKDGRDDYLLVKTTHFEL